MKKTVTIIISILIFLINIPILVTAIPVFANEAVTMDFNKATKILIENNGELKSLKKSERDSFSQYQIALAGEKVTDIEGVTYQFGGEKFFFEYDAYTKMLMTKKKELDPIKAKYDWDSSVNNLEIKQRNLVNDLKGLYLELEKAYLDVDVKNRSYNLEIKKNQAAKIKLGKGLLSKTDLMEAEYNLNLAQKEYNTAKRNWDNTSRSFNLFIGVPIDTNYDSIFSEQTVDSMGLLSINYCVQEALANRMEIQALISELKITELDLDIITRKALYKAYTDLGKEYDNDLMEIEELKFKLEKAKYDIEYEIKNSFTELVKGESNLNISANSLKAQRLDFIKTQAKYKSGLITKLDFDQAEITELTLENKYKIDVFNFNTKALKFRNAIGIGPEY